MEECFGMNLTADADSNSMEFLLDSRNVTTFKQVDGKTRISFKASRKLFNEMKRILNSVNI